jgi:hypothetical protein
MIRHSTAKGRLRPRPSHAVLSRRRRGFSDGQIRLQQLVALDRLRAQALNAGEVAGKAVLDGVNI